MSETKNAQGAVMVEFIKQAIERELKISIEGQYETMKKSFLEQLDRDKASAIAGAALHVMKIIDIRGYDNQMVISLRTEGK